MDPLTPLSKAGSSIQFLDFAIKILTTNHQLYRPPTGSLSAHDELKFVTRELSGLAAKLNLTSPSQSVSGSFQNEDALEDICEKCETIAEILMRHLKTLRLEEKKGVLKSFRSALKATWDQKELKSVVQRLQLLRESLEGWLVNDDG